MYFKCGIIECPTPVSVSLNDYYTPKLLMAQWIWIQK